MCDLSRIALGTSSLWRRTDPEFVPLASNPGQGEHDGRDPNGQVADEK
jgi:hypothetical protein